MPIVRAPYVRQPYAGNGLIRLADLGMQTAHARANAVRESGDRSAQTWSMAGNAISEGIGAVRQERALVPLRQAAAAKLAHENELIRRQDEAYGEQRAAKEQDAAKAARLQALLQGKQGQRPSTQEIIEAVGAMDAPHVNKALDDLFPKAKEAEAFTLNPGDVRFDGTGKQIATVTKPEPVVQPKYTSPLRMSDGSYKQFEEGKIPADAKFWNEPNAPPAPRAPIWVIGPDGEFKDLAGVAPPGSKPSNTREQGRPVTSGDAGRIAEFDTSLDDLGILTNALTAAGSTGTVAKAGASMPNWVTEFTGWGSDAKKKQALIDRVKQVIGKALEGGVLRKEDELKYEKILPTIGDPNELVISKLGGISSAIKLRRSRTVDSLTDAGYDTSKFGEYKSPLNNGTTAAPDLSGLKPGSGRRFTSGPFAGQTWSVDEQGRGYKVGG